MSEPLTELERELSALERPLSGMSPAEVRAELERVAASVQPGTVEAVAAARHATRRELNGRALAELVLRVGAIEAPQPRRGRGRPRKGASKPAPGHPLALVSLALAAIRATPSARRAVRLELARARMLSQRRENADALTIDIGGAFVALLKREGIALSVAALVRELNAERQLSGRPTVTDKTVRRHLMAQRQRGLKLGC